MSHKTRCMTPDEIRALVKKAGTVKAFAEAVMVCERYAYYLLAGKRKMSRRAEELARRFAKEKVGRKFPLDDTNHGV